MVDAAGPPPPPAAPSEPDNGAAPRTTSLDLSDLIGQLGDGTEGSTVAPDAPLTDPRDVARPEATAVVIESTGAIKFDPEFASFAARAGGWAIDTAITTAAMLPGFILLVTGSGVMRLLAILLMTAGVGLVAWSYTVAVARTGQWLGNRITSTTVVNVSSGDFIDQPRAFTRFAIRALISPIFFAGFIVAFTNSSRRTFHDQAADTIVTRPRRATWSIDDEGA